jgi:hypothetical protein
MKFNPPRGGSGHVTDAAYVGLPHNAAKPANASNFLITLSPASPVSMIPSLAYVAATCGSEPFAQINAFTVPA